MSDISYELFATSADPYEGDCPFYGSVDQWDNAYQIVNEWLHRF